MCRAVVTIANTRERQKAKIKVMKAKRGAIFWDSLPLLAVSTQSDFTQLPARLNSYRFTGHQAGGFPSRAIGELIECSDAYRER